jgi:hypothetical protein
MNSNNKEMLLRDEATEPRDAVLEQALGKELFGVYQELMSLAKNEFDLVPEWRFYKDGKAWLCKIVYKKKTILWLSIWENFIKTGFYFTEKTRLGVLDLEIDPKLKGDFSDAKPIGRLLPLSVDIETKEHFKDLKAIIKYKKSLK